MLQVLNSRGRVLLEITRAYYDEYRRRIGYDYRGPGCGGCNLARADMEHRIRIVSLDSPSARTVGTWPTPVPPAA